MQFQKRRISGFAVIVSLIVIFTAVFIFVTPSTPLTPYSGTEAPEETTSSPAIALTEYQSEDPLFTVQVPSDWVKVTQGGYPTWISKEYSSSLQIQTFPASSSLLNITGDLVRAEIEAAGGQIVDFYWMDQWDYTVSYRMYQDTGSTAHIEVTAFNTKDAVRFVFVITEAYYSEVADTVAAVLDSFYWDRFSDGQTPSG